MRCATASITTYSSTSARIGIIICCLYRLCGVGSGIAADLTTGRMSALYLKKHPGNGAHILIKNTTICGELLYSCLNTSLLYCCNVRQAEGIISKVLFHRVTLLHWDRSHVRGSVPRLTFLPHLRFETLFKAKPKAMLHALTLAAGFLTSQVSAHGGCLNYTVGDTWYPGYASAFSLIPN